MKRNSKLLLREAPNDPTLQRFCPMMFITIMYSYVHLGEHFLSMIVGIVSCVFASDVRWTCPPNYNVKIRKILASMNYFHFRENKATLVVRRWAGAMIEKVIRAFGQE